MCMNYSVIRGSSYILIHAPDMTIHNGTTQTTERYLNPDSQYLKDLPDHLRTYDEVVNYHPNQVYIGNLSPEDLRKYEQPWYNKGITHSNRIGKFGEIAPQDEFIGIIKIVDVFGLVKLSQDFTKEVIENFRNNYLLDENLINKLGQGDNIEDIEKLVSQQDAEPIYNNNILVGCVKKAHAIDANLSAKVLFENLVAKASGVLSTLHLLDKNDIDPKDIDYIIECSEEACGDMNQRGGG